MKDNKQRLFEVMKKLNPSFKRVLNEDAFNDAGEPMMTHSQFRDYSEPSEPDNDEFNYNRGENQMIGFDDVTNQIDSHFDTLLRSYGTEEYYFPTIVNAGESDFTVWLDKNKVGAVAPDGKQFEQQYLEELNMEDLLEFLEPYRKYMLTGADAIEYRTKESDDIARDDAYAQQERNATGG